MPESTIDITNPTLSKGMGLQNPE